MVTCPVCGIPQDVIICENEDSDRSPELGFCYECDVLFDIDEYMWWQELEYRRLMEEEEEE